MELRSHMQCVSAITVVFVCTSLPVLGHANAPTYMTVSFALASALIALSTMDIYTYRLPDLLTLPLVGAGLVVSYWLEVQPVLLSAVSALFGFILLFIVAQVYRHVRHRAGIGLGDAKLLSAAGAWLGAEAIPTVLLLASMSGLVWAGLQSFVGSRLTATTRLPFGPFLALGMWIAWLYGPIHSTLP